jgi:hypothetical protein
MVNKIGADIAYIRAPATWTCHKGVLAKALRTVDVTLTWSLLKIVVFAGQARDKIQPRAEAGVVAAASFAAVSDNTQDGTAFRAGDNKVRAVRTDGRYFHILTVTGPIFCIVGLAEKRLVNFIRFLSKNDVFRI